MRGTDAKRKYQAKGKSSNGRSERDLDSFAFIIHPIDPKQDVSRKYPLLGRLLTEKQIDFFSTFFPPVYISEIDGITSVSTGKQIKGWFLACPYTPSRMLQLPVSTVYKKIIQTGHMAERLGARMIGLGAYTSIVGDAGITIARELDAPVTTGDAYTAAVVVQTIREAVRQMQIPIEAAHVAVVGATGTIGSVCSKLLAEDFAALTLIGRRLTQLDALRGQILESGTTAVTRVSTDLDSLREAHVILTASSSVAAIIQPAHLRSGSIVCDVARPRDVSAVVGNTREDVLVIDGGIVEVPGSVDFHFDFGLPPGMAFACMAETMALTLEGHFEDYTLGREISLSRVKHIASIAEKHGFRLRGFRSFDRFVSDAGIERVRSFARIRI